MKARKKDMNSLKKEIRVLGIDDSPFDKFRDRSCRVIGTVFRGGQFMDGVLSTHIRVDGLNSTAKIVEMVNTSHFRKQLRCIFLDGINMAGFNVIDIHRLHDLTKIPIIVITRKRPDTQNIKRVLKKLGMERKISLLEKAGEPERIGKIYVQVAGIPFSRAEHFIRTTATRSFIPEPLRAAHLIAAGVALGQSKGGA
ncbi:DUF99 family protein [Candidatus Woesearchaeota archaeon]|nr:DUF99 family protein [Candidatus Woesearchaeota archaeon]